MNAKFNFGHLMRLRRKSLDLTQKELAYRIGCATITVQKIESGDRRPSKQVAERIAICLGIREEKLAAFVSFARGKPYMEPLSGYDTAPQMFWAGKTHPPIRLPLPPTPFLGRDQDVASVCKRLNHVDIRLITLTGPPGVGKTRLGLQVALDMGEKFEDGVFFVPLASIADPDLIVPAIMQAMRLKDNGHQQPVDHLVDYLWDKRVLLILDNFEHLVSASKIVTRLLSECALLKVLITSRTALRVRGEHRFPVLSLALPDPHDLPNIDTLRGYSAIALFIDRAQAVNPDFTLTQDNAPFVTAICRRLDGLPLAIELIATYIRLLPPHVLLDHLDTSFLLQSDGLRDLDDRQQTLWSTIDWSFCLLMPEEQTLFERLAVFVGGWTLDALESVCLDEDASVGIPSPHPAHILSILSSLVNNNLIIQSETHVETRFSMLETIREYAWDKLKTSGMGDMIRWRYVMYYLRLSEEALLKWQGPEQVIWFDRFELEHRNLCSALEWLLVCSETDDNALLLGLRLASALFWFWSRRGYLREGRFWLKRSLAQSQRHGQSIFLNKEHISLHARVLYSLGVIAWLRGDLIEARPLLEESVSLWQELDVNGEQGCAYAKVIQVMVEKELGNHEQAYSIGMECTTTLRQFRDEWGLALALNCFGSAVLEAGDYAQAQCLLEESAKIFRKLGDEWGLSLPLIHLSLLAVYQGRYDVAGLVGEESLTHLRNIGDREQIAYLLNLLGDVAQFQGNGKQARLYYEESLTLWQIYGYRSFAEQVKHKLETL